MGISEAAPLWVLEQARDFTGFHVLAGLFFLQALVQWVLGYRSGKIGRGR
jgi:hypothetical protein